MPARILIFANKAWETDPLMGVFRNEKARPPKFPAELGPDEPLPEVTIPMSNNPTKKVKPHLALKSANATAELWCIQDLMDSDPPVSSSSSEEKARVMPYVTACGADPTLVVAFGTATMADARSYNGCVVVGANVFVYNAYRQNPNPKSKWNHPDIGKLVDASQQSINKIVVESVERDRALLESRFIMPPINPAMPPTLIVSAGYVAVSNVNITDPSDYAWADAEALMALAEVAPHQSVGSVETTHGVIRLVVPSPQFLFISGIANRVGYFNMEVAPRTYAQNFSASHNAAVTLAWIIPQLMA
jgi:hypothetical protein